MAEEKITGHEEMDITILAVDPGSVSGANIDRENLHASGYLIDFRAQLVEGKALFVPYGSKSDPPYVGAVHSVESEFERISGFERRKPHTAPGISRVEKSRDYDIVATVTLNDVHGLIEVVVGQFERLDTGGVVIPNTSLFLALDSQDTLGKKMVSSDVVSFRLHELIFYDQGYR